MVGVFGVGGGGPGRGRSFWEIAFALVVGSSGSCCGEWTSTGVVVNALAGFEGWYWSLVVTLQPMVDECMCWLFAWLMNGIGDCELLCMYLNVEGW